MTTVVYRAGVMAGDSQVSSGNTALPETVSKVRRLRDGRLFGFSGGLGVGEAVFKALDCKTPIPTPPKGCEYLIVDQKGRLFCIEEGHVIRVYGQYAAIGSGANIALGALAMGASAVEALRIARAHDNSTGGRIRTVKLRK